MKRGAECAPYKKKVYFRPVDKMDNYACLDPDDFGKFLAHCKDPQHQPKPSVYVCLINGPLGLAECDRDNEGFTAPIEQLDNYACMSPRDMRKVLVKCKATLR